MARVAWDSEAAALEKVPFMVRPLARRKVEERVAAQGRQRVSLVDVSEAEARFRAVMGGRSSAELPERVLPQDNRPSAGLTVLEACRSELSGCPNRLIDVEAWRQALQEWLESEQVSERLRARVRDPQVLFHHKLRLAMSGCPNGCSRPQIADLALVGFVRPEFHLDHCQGCRACQKACPTECIDVSAPAARLLMGSKLGHHPHLAAVAGEAPAPEQAVARFRDEVEQFINTADADERFAAWWTRTH